jgi:hypothetical protein
MQPRFVLERSRIKFSKSSAATFILIIMKSMIEKVDPSKASQTEPELNKMSEPFPILISWYFEILTPLSRIAFSLDPFSNFQSSWSLVLLHLSPL